MVISGRSVLLGLAVLIAAIGVAVSFEPGLRWLALVATGCAIVILLLVHCFRPAAPIRTIEADVIEGLPDSRHRELIRGTSLFLREMRYRYSIRMDRLGSAHRPSFTEDVNTIRLGFLPVIITDNHTDRQGYGYVAFVYDGKRWRGPGVPCPAGREEAISHARRCVAPLEASEEPAEGA